MSIKTKVLKGIVNATDVLGSAIEKPSLKVYDSIFNETNAKQLRKGANKFKKGAINTTVKGAKITGEIGSALGKITGDALGKQVKQVTKGTLNLASTLVREDKTNSLIGYRLKKRGLALAAGVSVVGAVAKETKSYVNEDLRGRVDPYTTPISPQINSGGYQNFGQQSGATGDLVFALNKNRRG